jgi:microtubule-associated protein-like 1/2
MIVLTCRFDQRACAQVAKLEGHSSFINHIDWSKDSTKLQSNCGAHELLYWKLYKSISDDPRTQRFAPHQEKSSSRMKDEEWDTQTSIYGWSVRGIWPEGADGTDINACARNHTGERDLVATSDDFGTVKLFRYPCIVPNADCKPYSGHSSHVTNVGFSVGDKWLVSTGGEDRGVFQWEVVREELKRG